MSRQIDPAVTDAVPLVIAIDGPAAAGKGTLARRIALAYGLPHLDTGLLYRAVARRLLDQGLDPRNEQAAVQAAEALQASDLARNDLRGPEADQAASAVATLAPVRAALVAFQRRFASRSGGVLDGRDIGTVIFPDATVKLFVTASPSERASRRHAELLAAGRRSDAATVLADVQARDAQDESRSVAPLRPAADAVVIDTTGLDPDAVLARALAAIEAVRAR